MTNWDAIVVGGGFAGIMAARELSEAGLTVLVLEGRDRLGGRTEYREMPGTDANIELGGTYLDDAQPHVQREAKRYGVELRLPPVPERFIWHLDGRRWEGGFPVPWEEAVEAERALAEIRAAAARIRMDQPHYQQGIEDLDVSIQDFVDRLSVGPVTRDFLLAWAALYTGDDGLEASALYHLHSISTLGGSPVALAPSLILASGTSSLIEAIAGDCTGEIRLSARVTSVVQGEKGVLVTTEAGEELCADRAVIAIPVNTLKDVSFDPPLDEAKQILAREGHIARGYKFFALVENIPEAVQAVGRGVEGGVMWLSTDRWIGERNLLVGFSIPKDGFSSFDIRDVQVAVDAYIPGAHVVAVDGFDWNMDPFSRGTWMVPRAGQMTGLPGPHNADEGRLHFAGADLSLRWFSWIEGALETGHEAAHRLIAAAQRQDWKSTA